MNLKHSTGKSIITRTQRGIQSKPSSEAEVGTVVDVPPFNSIKSSSSSRNLDSGADSGLLVCSHARNRSTSSGIAGEDSLCIFCADSTA